MANKTKTEKTVSQVKQAISELPTEAKVDLVVAVVGEIARERAVSSFQNTINNIVGEAEAAASNIAGSAAKTSTPTKRRGRKKGSRNKPHEATTEATAKTTRTRPAEGNRAKDRIYQILATNSSEEFRAHDIASKLFGDKNFTSSSKDPKRQEGMVRTYLDSLLKDGLVERVKHGVYRAKQTETATANA